MFVSKFHSNHNLNLFKQAMLLLGLRARLEDMGSIQLDKDIMVKFMLKLMEENRVLKPEKEEKDGQETPLKKGHVKEMDEMQKFLYTALKSGKVANELIRQVLQKMNIVSEISTAQQFMDALPRIIEKGSKDLADSVEDLIKTSISSEADLLKFYLQVAKDSKREKTKYLCLQQIGKLLEQDEYCVHMLEEKAQNILLVLLLTQVFDPNDRIKKISLNLLKPLMKRTEGSKLNPIISFLSHNKTEMTSQVENIAMLLKKSEIEETSLVVLLEQAIQAPGNCFEVLIDLFSPLKSKYSVCRIAKYGAELVRNRSYPYTVKLIIDRFIKRIIKNISEKPCLEFFLEGSRSTETIVVAGLQTRLSTLLLEKAT